MRDSEEEVECDLLECYGIMDYRELPASRVALFVSGLPDDSRVKRKIAGLPCSMSILMQAMIVDRLSLLLWAQSSDGVKNRNRPELITDQLFNTKKNEQEKYRVFATVEEFEHELCRLRGGNRDE